MHPVQTRKPVTVFLCTIIMDLVNFNSERKYSSLYLVEQINLFRKAEGNNIKVRHSDILVKIEKRFESKINERKISPVEYNDKKGENRKMYELPFEYCLRILMDQSETVQDKCIEVMKSQQSKINELQNTKPVNNGISQIEQHTYRPVQIQSAKAANHYAFTKQNGKEDAMAWHRKNCFYFTGKTPFELKQWAIKNNVPSKDRTSGKEIIRKFRPDKAAGVSIADFIHSMGEPDDVALKIGEQAMPVVNMLLKYQDKQLK
jgi:hypothetical protein